MGTPDEEREGMRGAGNCAGVQQKNNENNYHIK
jgi:hypothetical protein